MIKLTAKQKWKRAFDEFELSNKASALILYHKLRSLEPEIIEELKLKEGNKDGN